MDKITEKNYWINKKDVRKTLITLRTTRANIKSAMQISSNRSVLALLKVALKDIEKSLKENNFA